MNLKNKKIVIFYNIFTFFILLLGILYIYLGEISMGFARDLVYREYLIEENVLAYISKEFFILLWFLLFLYSLYKSKKEAGFSFSNIVNIFTFLLLSIISYFYMDEYIIFLAVCIVFAILRLPLLYIDKEK